AAAITPMGEPAAATSGDSASPPPGAISTLVDELRAVARSRDSLITIADTSRGTSRDVLEESIWDRQVEIHTDALALADRIKAEQGRGADLAEVRRMVNKAVREEWPRYLAQLQRMQKALNGLSRASDAASGADRLTVEDKMTRQSERLLEAYDSFVDL